MEPTAENIISVYRSASPTQLKEGLAWYRDAHGAAASLDPENPGRAAGVIAALSPQTSWPRNLELADRAYADGHASGTLRRSAEQADRILLGEDPLDVLRGPKVRAFYAVIADPADRETVVVDRHAVDIAVGERLEVNQRERWFPLARHGWYQRFADAYREAAAAIGITPAELQAVTWVVWRDRWQWVRVAIPVPAAA